jgi:radical SAM protein with 4Fe4S-binding SPASM domain
MDINIERIANRIDDAYDGRPLPVAIEISINGACNRRCKFCPRVDENKYPNILESLDFDVYKRVIESLERNSFSGVLQFVGFCEPLLTRNLVDYFRIVPKNIKIDLVSNLDIIPDFDELHEAGLDNLMVSVYDGDVRYEELNRLIPDKYLNSLVFLRKRYSVDNWETLSNRAGAVDLESLGLKRETLPLSKPCYFPFYKMFIDYNGDVLICSHDWDKHLIVGNVHHEDIYDIWWSDTFMNVRRNLLESKRNHLPCQNCNVIGTLNGQQFFDTWKTLL